MWTPCEVVLPCLLAADLLKCAGGRASRIALVGGEAGPSIRAALAALARLDEDPTGYVLEAVRAGRYALDEVMAGLNTWLAATGTDWLTRWYDDQVAERARYLIGMLRRAARAGYITTAAGHPVDTTTRAERREAASRPAGPVMSFGPPCRPAQDPSEALDEGSRWAAAREAAARTARPAQQETRPGRSGEWPSLRELVDQYRARQPPGGNVDDQ